MSARRALLAAAVAAVLTVVGASQAAAHAVLDSSTPADGAKVAEAPTEVVLRFSENLTAPANAVRVVDTAGKRVDTGKVRVAGHVVHAALQPKLPNGAYIVSWRIISADSHPVRGAFTFAVGTGDVADNAAIASVFSKGADRALQIAGAIERAIAYLGALLAAGGALFLALVHEGSPAPRTAHRAVIGGAALGAAGVLAGLVIQADLATGLGLGALFRSAVRADVLGAGVGVSTAVTLAGLAVVTGALRVRGPSGRLLLVAGGLASVGGFAAAGHTTQASPAWLVSTADVIHVAFGAAWLGGIVLLGITLHRRDVDDPAAAARTVGRFSTLATASVLAVGAAGFGLGWEEVRSIDALTSTTYGKLLLVKVAIVAAIAVAGAYNRFVLVPVVTATGAATMAWRRLRRTVSFEAGAMVCVIAVTAVLVNVTPAVDAVSGPYSKTVPFGVGSVQVVVDPARTGPTSLHVYLLDAAGRPPTGATTNGLRVTLDLSLPSADVGPITRTPVRAGPGHFELDGNDFTLSGRWRVTVRARVSQFEDVTATVDVPIRP